MTLAVKHKAEQDLVFAHHASYRQMTGDNVFVGDFHGNSN
jgi:hypothetical protein